MFGLGAPRHVSAVHEDPESIASRLSWWDAEPVELSRTLVRNGKAESLVLGEHAEDLGEAAAADAPLELHLPEAVPRVGVTNAEHRVERPLRADRHGPQGGRVDPNRAGDSRDAERAVLARKRRTDHQAAQDHSGRGQSRQGQERRAHSNGRVLPRRLRILRVGGGRSQRADDLREKIRPRRIPLQVRIALALVIIQSVGLEETSILDQKLDRLIRAFCSANGFEQHFRRATVGDADGAIAVVVAS